MLLKWYYWRYSQLNKLHYENKFHLFIFTTRKCRVAHVPVSAARVVTLLDRAALGPGVGN